jgi:hypothetical protein
MTTLHCGDVNNSNVNFPKRSRNWNHGIVGRVRGSLWGIAGPKVVWTQTTLNNFHNHVLTSTQCHHYRQLTPPSYSHLLSSFYICPHRSSTLASTHPASPLDACLHVSLHDRWAINHSSEAIHKYRWKLMGSTQSVLSF